MGMVILKTLGRRRDVRFSKRKICSSLVASTLVYLKSANVYVQNTDSHAPYPAPTHPPRPSSHSVKPFFPNPCLDTNKYLNPTHTTPPLPPKKMVPPPPPPPPFPSPTNPSPGRQAPHAATARGAAVPLRGHGPRRHVQVRLDGQHPPGHVRLVRGPPAAAGVPERGAGRVQGEGARGHD